jgi:hypothetical protein
MSPVRRAEAFRMIRETRDAVHWVDPYVDGAVEDAEKIYHVRFQDDERFLALIFPEMDGCRILTPPDEPRTLRDVANRIIYNEWTFDELVEDMGLDARLHDPGMFAKTRYIDETFFIYDGFHRSLVLAKYLLEEEVDYQQVEGILVIPRPL